MNICQNKVKKKKLPYSSDTLHFSAEFRDVGNGEKDMRNFVSVAASNDSRKLVGRHFVSFTKIQLSSRSFAHHHLSQHHHGIHRQVFRVSNYHHWNGHFKLFSLIFLFFFFLDFLAVKILVLIGTSCGSGLWPFTVANTSAICHSANIRSSTLSSSVPSTDFSRIEWNRSTYSTPF